jgi:CubicO group peptidase (beta-lactamase class C family)
MFAKSLYLFSLFLIIFSQPPNFENSWSKFTKQWVHEMQTNKIVGSNLAFIQFPTLQKSEFYGLADTSKPVTSQTIFHWASITKTFTGIAIMQLRDRGLLNLDDSVVRYIPELTKIYSEYGNISDITIRQLMSHSAGFRDASWVWGGNEVR